MIFAGNGSSGAHGDGGLAVDATLNLPQDVWGDSIGNVYIADMANSRIRKVDSIGIITTITGKPLILNGPSSVWGDSVGNLYITDPFNRNVQKLDVNGNMSVIQSGGVANAVWGDIVGNTFYAEGSLYDGFSFVRKIEESGEGSIVAGTGHRCSGGDCASSKVASMGTPRDIWVDTSGNIFIVDATEHRIRRIDKGQQVITTIAGGGSNGEWIPGMATSAKLSTPNSIWGDTLGNIFVSVGRSESCDCGRILKLSCTNVANSPELPTAANETYKYPVISTTFRSYITMQNLTSISFSSAEKAFIANATSSIMDVKTDSVIFIKATLVVNNLVTTKSIHSKKLTPLTSMRQLDGNSGFTANIVLETTLITDNVCTSEDAFVVPSSLLQASSSRLVQELRNFAMDHNISTFANADVIAIYSSLVNTTIIDPETDICEAMTPTIQPSLTPTDSTNTNSISAFALSRESVEGPMIFLVYLLVILLVFCISLFYLILLYRRNVEDMGSKDNESLSILASKSFDVSNLFGNVSQIIYPSSNSSFNTAEDIDINFDDIYRDAPPINFGNAPTIGDDSSRYISSGDSIASSSQRQLSSSSSFILPTISGRSFTSSFLSSNKSYSSKGESSSAYSRSTGTKDIGAQQILDKDTIRTMEDDYDSWVSLPDSRMVTQEQETHIPFHDDSLVDASTITEAKIVQLADDFISTSLASNVDELVQHLEKLKSEDRSEAGESVKFTVGDFSEHYYDDLFELPKNDNEDLSSLPPDMEKAVNAELYDDEVVAAHGSVRSQYSTENMCQSSILEERSLNEKVDDEEQEPVESTETDNRDHEDEFKIIY